MQTNDTTSYRKSSRRRKSINSKFCSVSTTLFIVERAVLVANSNLFCDKKNI